MSLELDWNQEIGYGYFPCDEFTANEVYNKEYFDRYTSYEPTDIGKAINANRVSMWKKYHKEGSTVDVGIGSGAFIREIDSGLGFDINPVAIDSLKRKNQYFNPYTMSYNDWNVKMMTFFDSLEHIKEPNSILGTIPLKTIVIVALPIFRNKEHVLNSKHFRKDEHFHYFTEVGFIRAMRNSGFVVLEVCNKETLIGREDILTFVFYKEELC